MVDLVNRILQSAFAFLERLVNIVKLDVKKGILGRVVLSAVQLFVFLKDVTELQENVSVCPDGMVPNAIYLAHLALGALGVQRSVHALKLTMLVVMQKLNFI